MTLLRNSSAAAQATRIHALFVGAFIFIILASWLLSHLYHVIFDQHISDSTVLLKHYRSLVAPKPVERFVFLTLALMAPVGLFGTGLFLFRRAALQPFQPTRWATPLLLAVTTLLYMPLTGFELSFGGTISSFAANEHLVSVVQAMSLAVACFWYLGIAPALSKSSGRSYGWIVWLIFFGLGTLQIASWRLMGERSITQSGAWFNSADAVFYSIGQIAAGRTLLVDLPSQYGLFPIFLQPVFKVVGLSIMGVSSVFALMQICSLAAVHAVAQRVIRDKAIKITYTLTLLAVTFGTMLWLIGLDDPYFQYWPIRFFWPAISLFAFYRYSRNSTPWNAFSLSLIGAVGSLWNSDSGLVIVIAFAGVLSAKWVVLGASSVPKKALKQKVIAHALLVHIATFIFCLASMCLWLTLITQGAVNWTWVFEYQHIFYRLGFMMLPMPIYHFPWMSIMGIYLLSLLVATQIWAHHPQSKTAELLLFLGLLGLGLFVYYQGRSHVLNLISVSWPAITLLAILSDRTLRGVRAGLLGRSHLAHPIAGLSVLLILSGVLLTGIPRMLEQARGPFESRNEYADEVVSDELAFIRREATPGEKCAILSLRQGLYHAATGLASPLSGPGYVEMLLLRDRDNLIAQLAKGNLECVFVGLGKSSELNLGVEIMSLMSKYEITAQGSMGSIVLMRPINQAR